MENNKKIHYAWWILVGLIVMMGLTRGGLNNDLSQILMPINKELGFSIGALSIIFSVSAATGIIWNPIAGKLLAKYDVRIIATAAIIIHGLTFAALGMTSNLYIMYGLGALMIFGSSYTTMLIGPVMVNRWFKEKKGFALGLLMALVGIIGAGLQPIMASTIVSSGWRTAMSIMGFGTIIIALPVILLIFKNNPQKANMLPYGATANEGTAEQQAKQEVVPGITCSAAIKMPAFWALALAIFFINGSASFGAHIAAFSTEAGYATQTAGTAVSVWLLGMTIGAIILGALTDKLGAKYTAFITLSIGIIAVLLMITSRTILPMLYIALFLFGILTAGVGTLSPLLVSSLFGYKEYSQLFGYAIAAMNAASALLIPLYGFVYDFSQSYQYVLYLLLIFITSAFICILYAYKAGANLQEQW